MAASSQMSGVETIRRNSGWYIALGIVMILLGLFAVSYAFVTTLASVAVFGWLLIFTGIVHSVQAFQDRKWSGVLLHLFLAVLMAIVGVLVVAAPLRGALTITILLASYLIVGGLFRLIGSIALDVPGRGWMAFGAVVSMALGLMLWLQWPVSAFWAIGTFVGVDLMFQGIAWISMALTARRVSRAVGEMGTAR